MKQSQPAWQVRLTSAAEDDIEEIGYWTTERFGQTQSTQYLQLIVDALIHLKAGPRSIRVRPRRDISEHTFSLHIARRGRRARHLLVFHVISEMHREIEAVRILHDSMDVARHVPPTVEE